MCKPKKKYLQKKEKSVALATLVARLPWKAKNPWPRNIKKCCHGNTCCQVCRKTNQFQSVQGYEKQRTHKNICKSKKRKSVALATLVARCCRKTNQLQSVQGYGKQRTHKNIYKSKKHKKVLPWQHLLPGLPKN